LTNVEKVDIIPLSKLVHNKVSTKLKQSLIKDVSR